MTRTGKTKPQRSLWINCHRATLSQLLDCDLFLTVITTHGNREREEFIDLRHVGVSGSIIASGIDGENAFGWPCNWSTARAVMDSHRSPITGARQHDTIPSILEVLHNASFVEAWLERKGLAFFSYQNSGVRICIGGHKVADRMCPRCKPYARVS